MTNFFIDLHGCAKNQVDAEIISTRLTNLGLCRVEAEDNADIIIVNSCGFIKSAKVESLQSMLDYLKNYPEKKIILAGCLAERYADTFAKEIPEATAIFGNGDLSLIDEIIKKISEDFSSHTQIKLKKNKSVQKLPPIFKGEQKGVCSGKRNEFFNFPSSAYVKITEGCNNRCSFCAIPIIRGNLRSRHIDEITAEIYELIERGIWEINLIGQDLASFGTENLTSEAQKNKKHSPLYNLLKNILKSQKDFRIRLLYIHPDHFPLDILDLLEKDERIVPYFDIPFQSGDDKIIFAMNRRGKASQYIELIETIRKRCEKTKYGIAVFRTTFLCGFPGENEESFNITQEFLKKLECDWSGCFIYSREEDTVAANFPNQVSEKIAKKRAEKLQKIQTEITQKKLKYFIGQILDILIEEIIPIDENASTEREKIGMDAERTGIAIGRSWFQAPDVDGVTVVYFDLSQNAIVNSGNIVKCKITGISGIDIYGFLFF